MCVTDSWLQWQRVADMERLAAERGQRGEQPDTGASPVDDLAGGSRVSARAAATAASSMQALRLIATGYSGARKERVGARDSVHSPRHTTFPARRTGPARTGCVRKGPYRVVAFGATTVGH